MQGNVWILGEALMDCVAQPDGSLLPLMGGSPFNLARACALRLGGAAAAPVTGFLNPLSNDRFGDRMRARFAADGVTALLPASGLPTSLAVVQIHDGQPSYGFYREGIADRSYSVDAVLRQLESVQASGATNILHTGSLLLVPPENGKVQAVLQGARALGWTISVDVNLRPKLAADRAAYTRAVWQAVTLADWVKASDEDLEILGFEAARLENAPQIAAKFIANGSSRVALTFGDAGAWLQVDGVAVRQDVTPVEVVDTVGAGDTFWGNCLADWAETADGAASRVSQTLRLAMHAAAINCTRAGCQPPSRAELGLS